MCALFPNRIWKNQKAASQHTAFTKLGWDCTTRLIDMILLVLQNDVLKSPRHQWNWKKQKAASKHTVFTKLGSDCKTRPIKYDSVTAYFLPQNSFQKCTLVTYFLPGCHVENKWRRTERATRTKNREAQMCVTSYSSGFLILSTYVAFLLHKLLKWLINY